ncbi:MAG TPA: hypothetical protein VMH88_12000 [Gemmatimonadales bacterium]|nr:hypothetical protein [Gemmatimonadales bacterium]
MVRRSVFVVSCGLCLVTLRSNGWAQGTDTTSAAKLGHDSLASGVTLSGRLLRVLPVDDPRAALPLSPGVVLRSGPGEVGIAAAPQLQIRGGTIGGAAAYVDGAPVRFETLGFQNLVLGVNSLGQVEVTTGVPTVSVADARDGVVTYETRAGGPTLAGSVHAETDGLFGDGSSVGYNRFDGEAGGPFPGIRNLTWFISGGLTGQGSPYYGSGAADQPTFVMGATDTIVQYTDGSGNTANQAIPTYIQYSGKCGALGTSGSALNSNYGNDCQGLQRPMDWATQARLQGKVRFSYGGGSSLALTVVGSDLQRRFFPGAVIGAPSLYEGGRTWSRLLVVNWNQRLRQAGDLRLDVNMSVGSDKVQEGLLPPQIEVDTRAPGLWIELSKLDFVGLDSIPFPLTDQIIRNIRTNSGLRVPYLNATNLRNAQPFRLNPFGLSDQGWYTQGSDGLLSFASERRLNGRWAVAWDASQVHHVVAGVDATKTDLSVYASNLLSQIFMNAYVEHPKRIGAFAADRLEVGDLVADLGLRYDGYSPGGEFANVPGRIFTNPAWDPAAATSDAAYQQSVSAVFTPGRMQSFVLPRLRAAYRIDRTVLRLGYGTVVSPPAFNVLYGGINNDLSFTSVSSNFARDVGFLKRTTIELGVRQSIGDKVALDGALYRRGLNRYAYRVMQYDDPANPGSILNVNSLTTVDQGTATGVDAVAVWTPSKIVTGSVAYSLYHEPEVPSAIGSALSVTLHALNMTAMVRLPSDWESGSVWGTLGRDVTAAATYRVASGLPYSPFTGDPVVGPINPGTMFNGPIFPSGGGEQLPATQAFDLRLAKTIHTGRVSWLVYLDARNLFAFNSQIGAWTATGNTTNSLYEQQLLAPEYSNLQVEAQANGVTLPGGDIDLRPDCSTWTATTGGPVNCVALRRVEQRFGNGDGVYTLSEQTRALTAFYDSFYGAWRFYGPGRTLRLALALTF